MRIIIIIIIMSDFYVTLPSDGSMRDFPDNTISTFRTRLPQTMKLQERDWEVALSEVVYPTVLNNVDDGCNYFEMVIPYYYPGTESFTLHASDTNRWRIRMDKIPNTLSEIPGLTQPINDKGVVQNPRANIFRIAIKHGFYRSARELVDEINYVLEHSIDPVMKGPTTPPNPNKVRLTYNTSYNRVALEFTGATINTIHFYYIRFCNRLALQLGFLTTQHGRDPTAWLRTNTLAPVPPDVYMGMSGLYLYSDVVQTQIVGSQNLQLMRIIPFENQKDNNTNGHAQWEGRHREYLPISKHYFDTVDIHIRNDMGEKVPFFSGKAIVKLHFRRKQL